MSLQGIEGWRAFNSSGRRREASETISRQRMTAKHGPCVALECLKFDAGYEPACEMDVVLHCRAAPRQCQKA